jgi:epoxyqueuosine reductase
MLYRTEHDDVARSEPVPGFPSGLVARYARGEDYHHVLKDRLSQLLAAIREECEMPVEGMAYTDTGPLLERDLAYAAGLGWRAKNTHLIHQNMGSYFFLGEILLDLDLTPGQPRPERCGSCQRCLDSCPTRAFLGPGVLDARRCISYLTIELKGPIPRRLRPLIGQMVFGCDICQEVCPWNRHAPVGSEAAYRPITGASPASLVELLQMTPSEFSERFRHSPLRRTKRRGIARNAAVALGNSGDPAVAPALCDALEDAEPLVRGHAAWALGRLGASEAMPALERRLQTEQDPFVRDELSLARDELANLQAAESRDGPHAPPAAKKPTLPDERLPAGLHSNRSGCSR